MTYRFDLRFISPEKGDPPFTPIWYIFVKHGSVDSNGAQAVTPTDSTESDIDEQVDELIKELESLRKKAKRKYANYRAKKGINNALKI